jgi:hypothetical protein
MSIENPLLAYSETMAAGWIGLDHGDDEVFSAGTSRNRRILSTTVAFYRGF